MANHQELVNPRQRDELRCKGLGLRRRRSERLHHLGHFLRQLFGARHFRLINLHPRAGEHLHVDHFSDFHQPLNVRR